MADEEKLLAEFPLFKSFSQAELKELVEKSQVKTFAAGEAIIRFGQPGRFLGIMLDGEAEAVVADETGGMQRLGLLKRGDFLGEMSLLTGEPTIADVIALKECRLFLIPQDVFSSFLAIKPDAVRIMAKVITERLKNRQLDEKAQARVEDAWRSQPDPYGLSLSSSAPAKILVINCGSSSLKFSYYNTEKEADNVEGMVEKIGQKDSKITSSSGKGTSSLQDLGPVDHAAAFRAVVDLLTGSAAGGVIRDFGELTAVGHRVVHGGDKYGSPVMIDDEVIRDIDKCSRFAPLHNPPSLKAIRESMKLMPKVPQAAVFDTGFHQKMPLHAQLYGLPYEFYEKDRIRRYGFHGISHNYAALQTAAFLKRDYREMKIITCHLGSGASVCAIDHGRSVDTSMGLTPLEGLVMGTRSGDLDPSIVLYLIREKGLSVDETDSLLNRQSGLKGISGISNDLRELLDATDKGSQRAALAINVFCYRVRKYIGAYAAAMGGLDALVFTGGIGEGSALVRSLACQSLSYMGVLINDILNKTVPAGGSGAADISDESSRIKVLVVAADEGRMIARETIRILGHQNVTQVIKSKTEKKIPIEISAHHIHLSGKEVDALFGQGHELTRRSDLSQPGQYACEETVDLTGPKGKVERVRVLGPMRKETQVEISMTEEFKLGIKAPIRPSGDLDGTPGIVLEGPKGGSGIAQGVICSLRHIHMTPEDALAFGLKDRDVVMVSVKGERPLIFGDVLVRVSPDFRLSMHLDTDEANAAGIKTGMEGNLAGVQDHR